MKASIAVIIIFLISYINVCAQTDDQLAGKWVNHVGTEKVEIYKQDEKYFGKLIWLKDAVNETGEPLKDVNNPSPEMKNRELIGIIILSNLQKRRRNIWGGGKLYDIKSGRSYNCQIALKDANHIMIRAYFGLIIMGKSETWTRTD